MLLLFVAVDGGTTTVAFALADAVLVFTFAFVFVFVFVVVLLFVLLFVLLLVAVAVDVEELVEVAGAGVRIAPPPGRFVQMKPCCAATTPIWLQLTLTMMPPVCTWADAAPAGATTATNAAAETPSLLILFTYWSPSLERNAHPVMGRTPTKCENSAARTPQPCCRCHRI